MLLLIMLRLFSVHASYEAFISKPFYFTDVKVLNAYPKTRNGKIYTVVKVHAENGLTFFTSSNRKVLPGQRARLQIYPSSRIGFFEYLGYFYVKSRIKSIESESPHNIRQNLFRMVSRQHTDKSITSFYNAIFFASALPKELRGKISALGVSHLVALSGFHLGILWSLIYGLVSLLYIPFQRRYFPYRFRLLDVGLVSIVGIGMYVWFVDFPPSLVRSYAMMLVGWVAILFGIELLSFTFLATITMVLLTLFPHLIVSLGFWLSVTGVFYIFLILQHTIGLNRWLISLVAIPLGIFILMLPVVHIIFEVTTPYQLLSPLLSVLFIPFYPVVMFLHAVGQGGLLDDGLQWLFALPATVEANLLTHVEAAGYLLLSFAAVWRKELFYVLLISALSYMTYLFI